MNAHGSLPTTAIPRARSHLFQPLALRSLTLKNRIVASPMAMYGSRDGFMSDFHLVHLGRFALGGAGLIMTEAVAVTAEGRITPGCAGLWSDAHAEGLGRVADFLHACGGAAGIQLAHAGPKGSSERPWEGGNALKSGGWRIVGPTATPFDAGWPAPQALTPADIDGVVAAFAQAARRARMAGFDVAEIHCAHGYLLHSFLSPITNTRADDYGGTREGRMRLPLRVAEAVRKEWPSSRPVFVRISAVDGIGVGWQIEDSIAFAKELRGLGVDAADCSTGGIRIDRAAQVPAREPGFQVPYAQAVRAGSGLATVAVGLIRDAQQADAIIRGGHADLVAVARELLANPNWPAEAAIALEGAAGWSSWPERFRYWLERRARQLAPRAGNKAG